MVNLCFYQLQNIIKNFLIITGLEETSNRIFVNRDVNACKNILHLAKRYLTTQTGPIEFCRKPKDKVIKKVVKKIKKEIVV